MNRLPALFLWASVIAFLVAAYVGYGQAAAGSAMAQDFNGWLALGFGLYVASHAARET